MAQDITVAVAGPMTGGQATFGRQMRNGAEQAVADINAAGGVLGRKLKLEVGDDACDPKQARSVAEKLVRHAGGRRGRPLLLIVVDPGLRRLSRRRRPADHAGARPIRCSPIAACGTRSAPAAATTSRAASPPAIWRRISRTRTIAIINDKTTYGKGLADEVKKALNAAGVKEKLNESYNQGDKDFTALVSKLKLNGIDIVYDGGYHQEAGLIVRQMRDQGLKTILMAGDALADRANSPRSPGRRAKACCSPSARSAQAPDRRRHREEVQGQGHRSGGLHALHLCRLPGLGAGGRQGRHHSIRRKSPPPCTPAPGTRCSARSPSTRRATSPPSAGPSTAGTKTATTTRSHEAGRAERVSRARRSTIVMRRMARDRNNCVPIAAALRGMQLVATQFSPAPGTSPSARSSPA